MKQRQFPIEGQTGPSGTRSGVGYSVEARFDHRDPRVIAGQTLDQRWRSIHFDTKPNNPAGVPAPRLHLGEDHGLMGYAQAQAMRWWFVAVAEAESVGGGLCLETRLVKHRIVETHTVTPTEYVDPLTSRGEVPADMIAAAPDAADAA